MPYMPCARHHNPQLELGRRRAATPSRPPQMPPAGRHPSPHNTISAHCTVHGDAAGRDFARQLEYLMSDTLHIIACQPIDAYGNKS
jgi:hypothetical protein